MHFSERLEINEKWSVQYNLYRGVVECTKICEVNLNKLANKNIIGANILTYKILNIMRELREIFEVIIVVTGG